MDGATSLWCPSCRAEYRPHVYECSDCLVPLVDELPVEVDVADHSLAEWELHDWDDLQLRALFRQLEGALIDYEWDAAPNTLRASVLREDDVDGLLATFDRTAELVDEVPVAESRASFRVAGLGRRAAGGFVDAGLLPVLLGSLVHALTTDSFRDPSRWTSVALIAFTAINQVVGVAVWGRTLGKLCVETRVVGAGTEQTPGWRAALLRAALPIAAAAVHVVGLLGMAIVYGPAVFDEERRGLHDRLAGTVVVEAH